MLTGRVYGAIDFVSREQGQYRDYQYPHNVVANVQNALVPCQLVLQVYLLDGLLLSHLVVLNLHDTLRSQHYLAQSNEKVQVAGHCDEDNHVGILSVVDQGVCEKGNAKAYDS